MDEPGAGDARVRQSSCEEGDARIVEGADGEEGAVEQPVARCLEQPPWPKQEQGDGPEDFDADAPEDDPAQSAPAAEDAAPVDEVFNYVVLPDAHTKPGEQGQQGAEGDDV